MATLKDVKRKIAGVKKTKQITKAMNMVAASRLRGAQSKMEAFRPYAIKFLDVLENLSKRTTNEASQLLIPKEKVENVLIILCTSDRGLCGGFNTNLVESVDKFVNANTFNPLFINFGKKGRDWCKREKHKIVGEYIGVVGSKFDYNIASEAGIIAIEKYLNGDYDEVYLVYSKFVSMSKQIPTISKILPIHNLSKKEESDESEDYIAEYLYEPKVNELLEAMLPKNIYVQLFSALLETSTSEHAARMLAMDNASKACNDMIEELSLAYNKARQAAITKELMDIVGGAEALKG